MIGIYVITNPIGRKYVGQSVNIEYRWKSYKTKECKSQIKLNRSFIKYGVDNHLFEVIEECNVGVLNEKERHYQEINDCVNNGLNCRFTTTKDKTGYFSDESKLKMSISGKAKIMTEEHRYSLKNSNLRPMLGRKHTKESLALMSQNRKGTASRKGCILSEETKNKIASKAIGRKASDETKLKMSITRKGKPQSDDLRNKRAMAQTKIIMNTETGIFYFGVKEIVNLTKYKECTLREKLTGVTKNNTNFLYV